MSRLVETIRIEGGSPRNLEFHNERMSMALHNLFGINRPVKLEDILEIPAKASEGIWKCRVLYERAVREIQFIPYKARTIRSLKLIHDDRIVYPYKYTDRQAIQDLFEMRGDCDDILIIKKGAVTDTSYSNIIFRTHSGRWVTPSGYLLPGTMRASLIHSGKISVADITFSDITRFVSFRLINAMMGFDESDEIPVGNII